jgi:peroxin-2
MRLLLDCAMFACTTGVNRPTPGMELMNLRLRDERGDHGAATTTMKTGVEGPGLSIAQRIAYGLATCVVGYGWGLWQRKMLRERYDEDGEDDEGGGGWKYRAWKLSQTVENCYTMANFVNFCVFLRNGRYPTLLERALRARLVYQRPTMARVVDFEYLNQQLAWRELSELVLFTLPYLYSTRVRSTLGALTSRVGRGEASPPTNVADAPQRNRVAVQAYRCVACGCREPIHPFVAEPCGHPYCYYCLRARLVEQPTSCACVKCGKRVAEMRRLATTTS